MWGFFSERLCLHPCGFSSFACVCDPTHEADGGLSPDLKYQAWEGNLDRRQRSYVSSVASLADHLLSAVLRRMVTLTLSAVLIWLEHFRHIPLNSGGSFTKLIVVAHAPKHSRLSLTCRKRPMLCSLCLIMPPPPLCC